MQLLYTINVFYQTMRLFFSNWLRLKQRKYEGHNCWHLVRNLQNTNEFPLQRANNLLDVSMPWRYYEIWQLSRFISSLVVRWPICDNELSHMVSGKGLHPARCQAITLVNAVGNCYNISGRCRTDVKASRFNDHSNVCSTYYYGNINTPFHACNG